MKERLILILILALIAGCLFTPFISLYASATLPEEVSQAMPAQLTGLDIISKGTDALPVEAMPSLRAVSFRSGLLLAAVLCALVGGLLSMVRRRYAAHAGLLLSAVSLVLWLSYALYLTQLSASLLFGVLVSIRWTLWLGVIGAAGLTLSSFLSLRGTDALALDDKRWRTVSAVLAILALVMLLLPFSKTNIADGTFLTHGMDDQMRVTHSGARLLTGTEPLLSAAGDTAAFTNAASEAGIAELLALGGGASAVSNLFKIPTYNAPDHSMLWAGLACLLIGMLLQWLRKVDRWVPTVILSLGAALMTSAAFSMMIVDVSAAQFQGVTPQLMALGLGWYTVWPLLMALVAIYAAAASIMGIVRADAPYFINPIAENSRIRATALALLLVSLALLCAPVYSVGVYAPGKVNVQNPATSRSYSLVQMVFQAEDEALLTPTDRRGNPTYGEEPASNGYTAADVSNTVSGGIRRVGFTLLAAALLLIASIILLCLKKGGQRLIITLELVGAALIGVSYIFSTGAIPKEMGTMNAGIPLFAAMAVGAFSAFFTGFIGYRELPKKYKLFLMILPFLAFVFVFSYLPLAGWRYAFYNYKLGLPMDQQEYVGLKWFQQIVSSPAQRAEIGRVMKNTFGMSGLSLLTSWMPVAFAILLTEIRTNWFKKFAQIFTTLPNFISWVLVYSFALTIFSLDTGVFNHLLMRLGIITEPVAWLNSPNHIWIKMWAWNTWKGLGWGAIMYLAAIAGIDQELYEAARVDGAGRFRQILHITIPGILPTFFVLLLLSISNIINNGMDQYLVFQNAMNKSTIEVLDLYVYNISIGTRSSTTISLATAIGILKSIVSIVLLFLANRFSKLVRGESIV